MQCNVCGEMAARARIIRRDGQPPDPCRECAKAYGAGRRGPAGTAPKGHRMVRGA